MIRHRMQNKTRKRILNESNTLLESNVPEETNGFFLDFQNINAYVQKNNKKLQILNNVSGKLEPGQIMGIMGPSGAGKTSLMNILAGRTCNSYTGSIFINKRPITKSIRRKFCYVMQQDLFFERLTLMETLLFSATIRLPSNMPHDEKLKRVLNIAKVLGLEKCLNTVIGGISLRGLSGGEKKRASIACELLTNPKLILLDEPTTGLDSSSAYDMMVAIGEYSKNNFVSILTTIHQPNSQIFEIFQKILLLADGQVAYDGKRNEIVSYFNRLDLFCSENFNPADHIIEKVKNTKDKKLLLNYYINHNTIKEIVANDVLTVDNFNELEKWPSNFSTQFFSLGKRNFKSAKGHLLSKLNIIFIIIMSIVVSIFWFRIPRTEERISDRTAVLYFMVTHTQFNAVFQSVTAYPSECLVIKRERASGAYRLSAYIFSKYFSEIPLHLVLPLFFISVTYWTTNLYGNVVNFLAFLCLMILNVLAGQGIGIFIGTLITDFKKLLTVTSIFMLTNMLSAGWFVKRLPIVFIWLRYLSLMGYGFRAVTKFEYIYGNCIKCQSENFTSFQSCKQNINYSITTSSIQTITTTTSTTNRYINGYEIIKQLRMNLPIWFDIVMLIFFLIFYRFLAYINLRFIQRPSK